MANKRFDCIFKCAREERRYTAREHIIPESLGNRHFVLRKGVVCDGCNEVFSKLDEYFCHYHMGAGLKPLFVKKTKQGKGPIVPLKGEGAEIRRKAGGRITYSQEIWNETAEEQFKFTVYADSWKLEQKLLLPDVETSKISRFLAKVGIETLFYKKKEHALEGRFDETRNYACSDGRERFVPFWWGKHPVGPGIDIKLTQAHLRGEILLRTYVMLFIHGYLYVQPLDALEAYPPELTPNVFGPRESWLNYVGRNETIQREPIEIVFKSLQEPVVAKDDNV